MARYIVSSDSPIHVRPIDLSPETGLPGVPDTGGPGGWPGFPERPGHGLPPHLPPKDEWPPLPPWLHPGVGLPIPPTPEFPMVPVDPEEGIDPPAIWPPLPMPPMLPDLSGKTLALAFVFVSGHVPPTLRWIVIDNEEAMEKAKAALEKLKEHLPAGGIPGRPAQRPPG